MRLGAGDTVVPPGAPAACSSRVCLGARGTMFRRGRLWRARPVSAWAPVALCPPGAPVAWCSSRACGVPGGHVFLAHLRAFPSRVGRRTRATRFYADLWPPVTCPSRACGGPSRARHLPGRCGALVVLLRPFGAGWLAPLSGRGLRVCRTLSPHSSGDRATASGAVCVGSNPTGGAFFYQVIWPLIWAYGGSPRLRVCSQMPPDAAWDQDSRNISGTAVSSSSRHTSTTCAPRDHHMCRYMCRSDMRLIPVPRADPTRRSTKSVRNPDSW